VSVELEQLEDGRWAAIAPTNPHPNRHERFVRIVSTDPSTASRIALEQAGWVNPRYA
jgi:hypothetical protein